MNKLRAKYSKYP